jgi:hypothetical protein
VGPNHKSKGHKGWLTDPTPWPTGHTLSQFRPRLHDDATMLVYKGIPFPRVSIDWEEWPAGNVDGHPAIHHLQTNSIKSVEATLDLYIRILTAEFTHTTRYL